ncbi:hypothetical protein QQM79_14615 [Marinobacteraceae bacterium S3BR75-40.1]
MSSVTAIGNRKSTHRNLEQLSQCRFEDLDALYRAGHAKRDLSILDGAPQSRMLCVRYLDSALPATPIQLFAASRFFPWAGKRFQAVSKSRGEGINRIRLLGEREWFAFQTRVEASKIDGKPAILLDYDQPGNPWFIRGIRDELREVSPGLFIGPAMWQQGEHCTTVLWFGIDTRHNGA